MSLMAELGEGPPPPKRGPSPPHGPMGGPNRPPFNQPPHLMNDIIRAGLELERSTPRVSSTLHNYAQTEKEFACYFSI